MDDADKALQKLAEAIGDRAGLRELQTLFDNLDTDGSGELDINEFQAGLQSFGIGAASMDAARVHVIFNAIDTSGDGSVSVDEFSQIAKIQLELQTMHEHLAGGGSHNKETAAEMAAALKSGVRVNRSASTMGDVKMQGDLEMLTAEALAARQAIKDNPAVREFVEGWWENIDLKDDCGNMDKESYCCMSIALHKHFVEDVYDDDALATAEDDWLTDCPKGQDAMNFGE
jgi:hypothetical protein